MKMEIEIDEKIVSEKIQDVFTHLYSFRTIRIGEPVLDAVQSEINRVVMDMIKTPGFIGGVRNEMKAAINVAVRIVAKQVVQKLSHDTINKAVQSV